jgi:hypothetical protein
MGKIIILGDFIKHQKRWDNLPHSQEKIDKYMESGMLSTASAWRVENRNFLKMEQLRRWDDELSELCRASGKEVTDGRIRFLMRVREVISPYLKKRKELLDSDLSSNRFLLYWHLDQQYSGEWRFELAENDDLQIMIKRDYESLHTMILLLNLIDILQERRICVNDLIGMITE